MHPLVAIIVILVLVAWIWAISLLIQAAQQKGWYKDGGTGVLWFIGLCASPIVLALLIIALPDKAASQRQAASTDAAPKLPEL